MNEFGEDEVREIREVAGYCIYCKEEIYEDETYVVVAGNIYHKDCFKLVDEEDEE